MPEILHRFLYLVRWFWTLDAGRSGNGYGPNPIGYAEIAAWRDLCGEEAEPWEIAELRRMDIAYLDALAAKQDKGQGGQTRKPATQTQPLNTTLFDAMF